MSQIPHIYETATGVYEVCDGFRGGDTEQLMTSTEADLNIHLENIHLNGGPFFLGNFGFQFDGELASVLGHCLDPLAEKADAAFQDIISVGEEAGPFLQRMHEKEGNSPLDPADLEAADSLRQYYIGQYYHHMIAVEIGTLLDLGVVSTDRLSSELMYTLRRPMYHSAKDSFFDRFQVRKI